MQTILVAIDGSKNALEGVRYAAPIAKATGQGLELCYASPPVLLPPASYAEAIHRIEEAQRLHAQDVLKQGVELARSLGVEADPVAVQGPPAEAIADVATAPRVAMVVVSAKGHGPVSRVLLGSVADRLVHICTKPVLVVRTPPA